MVAHVKCDGKLCVTPNACPLGDEELEMIVMLRMNMDFMKFMRTNYNHLTKDKFHCTVVEPEADSAGAA